MFKVRRWLKVATSDNSPERTHGFGERGSTTVEIKYKDVCSYKRTVFTALWCSNDVLVITAKQSGKAVVMRYVEWMSSPSKRVVALGLEPKCRHVVVVTFDGSIYTVPCGIRLCSDLYNSDEASGEPHVRWPFAKNDVTHCGTYSQLNKGKAVSVSWWRRPSAEAQEYAIIGANNGYVDVVNLVSKTLDATLSLRQAPKSKRLKYVVTRIRILQRGKLLFVQTEGTECFHAPLLTVRADGSPEDLIDWCERDKNACLLSWSHVQRGRSVEYKYNDLAVVSTEKPDLYLAGRNALNSSTLEVVMFDFDTLLFVYSLPPNTETLTITDQLLFCVCRDPDTDQLHLKVCSTLLSVASRQDQPAQASSCLQDMRLSANETVLAAYSGPQFDHNSCCIVVTTKSVYEVRLVVSPDLYCLKLIEQGKDPTELAATFDVDLARVNKQASRAAIDRGDYIRAMELMREFESPHKVVAQLLRTGNLQVLSSYLATTLATPKELMGPMRKLLTHLLLLTHIAHLCSQYKDASSQSDRSRRSSSRVTSAELSRSTRASSFTPSSAASINEKTNDSLAVITSFLNDNWDYDAQFALDALAQYNLLAPFFQVAHVRGMPHSVVDLLMNGQVCLDSAVIQFLLKRDEASIVREHPMFLATMSDANLIAIATQHQPSIFQAIRLLRPRMFGFNVPSLLAVANFFHPRRTPIRILLEKNETNLVRSTASATSHTEAIDGKAVVQFFLLTLALLTKRRKETCLTKEELANVCPWYTSSTEFKNIMEGNYQCAAPSKEHALDIDSDSFIVTTIPPSDNIACGIQHSAAVLEGAIITWGKDADGRLGHGQLGEGCTPLVVEHFNLFQIKVHGVACGAEHTIVRTDDGLYAWGNNDMGQLGLGHFESRDKPTKIEELNGEDITNVVVGYHHCFAQSAESVWSWGANSYGQLGLGCKDHVTVPKSIPGTYHKQIVQLAAGIAHSVFLSAQGIVYTCGRGLFGELIGMGSVLHRREFEPVQLETTVRLIACGPVQTLLLTHSERLLMAGRSFLDTRPLPTDPKLSRTQRMGRDYTPTDIPLPCAGKAITQIAAGLNHALLLTDKGHVYSFGHGATFALGHGTMHDIEAPTRITAFRDIQIDSVAVGEAFSVAVDVNQQIFVWGQDGCGELGLGAGINEQARPAILPVPAVQSEHSKSASLITAPRTMMPLAAAMRQETRYRAESNAKDSMALTTKLRLPDLQQTAPPFGGWALSVSLHALAGLYAPTILINYFRDLQEWFGLSQLYAMLGNYAAAMTYRLKDLEYAALQAKASCLAKHNEQEGADISGSRHSGGDERVEESSSNQSGLCEACSQTTQEYLVNHIKDACTPLFELAIKAVSSVSQEQHAIGTDTAEETTPARKDFTQLISVFATFVEWHDLPRSILEDTLSTLPPSLASDLFSLVVTTQDFYACTATRTQTSPASELRVEQPPKHVMAVPMPSLLTPQPPEILLSLSIPFYLQLLREPIRKIELSTDLQPPRSTLWTSIASNLKKNMRARDYIHAHIAVPTAPPTETKSILFTCGHKFDAAYFLSHLVPELERRLQALPLPMERWLALVSQLYHQPTPPLACCHCVYAHARKVIMAQNRRIDVPVWRR
eukprot:m.340471 g.340471  ORF g.340471 m.340471 type:complete len:1615 (-) comp16105_c0_seq2:2986-7830(-)